CTELGKGFVLSTSTYPPMTSLQTSLYAKIRGQTSPNFLYCRLTFRRPPDCENVCKPPWAGWLGVPLNMMNCVEYPPPLTICGNISCARAGAFSFVAGVVVKI